MVRPNKEFVLAWSSLLCEGGVPGWQAIALPPAGSVEVQAGRRSPDNAEAVLFCFPTENLARSERLPEGKGFLVEIADFPDHVGLCLALTRQSEGSPELFTSMACDVVGAMDDRAANRASEADLLKVFLGRVRSWQQFMSRSTGRLSPEAELGLAGEVFFMERLLEAGVSCESVLRGWVGPNNAPQDFLLGDGAIEVKSTMSSSGFPAKIGSLEQLDDAVASPLFLAAVRFGAGDGGATLPEMIAVVEQRISEEPGAVDCLHERLIAAGYVDAHAGQYSRRFEPKEMRVFSVSECFPRLTQGIVPTGVFRATYEINLDHAGDFLRDFNEILLKLGANE